MKTLSLVFSVLKYFLNLLAIDSSGVLVATVLTCVFCLLCTVGSGADVRSECLRKLSSHVPLFASGDNTGGGFYPGSEISVESNAQLFGVHPFYIPRG